MGRTPGLPNRGNVAFGAGLLLAPLTMSYLFRKMSYENTVSVLALVIGAPVVLAVGADYPSRSGDAFQFAKAVSLLAQPAVLVAGLALFCYSALDVSFSNWLPAFGKEVLTSFGSKADPDAIDASAQRLISVYAVALMGGRFAASFVPALKDYGHWFVAAASLAVALLMVWMTRTRRAPLAWLLVLLVGLLTAPFSRRSWQSPMASSPRRSTAASSGSSSPGRCWAAQPCPRPSAIWPRDPTSARA